MLSRPWPIRLKCLPIMFLSIIIAQKIHTCYAQYAHFIEQTALTCLFGLKHACH